MTKLFHPLLALIASASDCHLRRQVRYLKEENQILRARVSLGKFTLAVKNVTASSSLAGLLALSLIHI